MLSWIKSLWRKLFPVKHHENPHEIPTKTPQKKQRGRDNMGSMYYLGDLLDSLDDYFSHIRAFKKADPKSYAVYRRLGGQVLNSKALLSVGSLHPSFSEIKPSFGLVHIADHDSKHEGRIYMLYYKKCENPYFVEKTNQQTYELSVMHVSRATGMGLHTGTAHIAVSNDGEIKLLREQEHYMHHIPGRDGGSSIPRIRFGYPRWLKTMCNEGHHRENRTTPEELAADLFAMPANVAMHANDGFQVVASKGGDNAVFNINMLRTPYFFKDRTKTVNHNGRTKRIFHIVRTHKRKIGSKEMYIKTHFRGLRKFLWNGYNVTIRKPKLGAKIAGLDLEATITPEDYEPPHTMIEADEFAERIDKVINA